MKRWRNFTHDSLLATEKVVEHAHILLHIAGSGERFYIYNSKFSHALLFWYKCMHRNYCFRCKRHSYAACDAALAASLFWKKKQCVKNFYNTPRDQSWTKLENWLIIERNYAIVYESMWNCIFLRKRIYLI